MTTSVPLRVLEGDCFVEFGSVSSAMRLFSESQPIVGDFEKLAAKSGE